ncbi:MAG: calcium-binding protein [Pseudomonadota bacterium]
MTTISFGPNSEDFLARAFFDSNLDEVNLAVLSWNSTSAVLRNRDTGLVTTLRGTGIVFDSNDEDAEPTSGTITAIEVRQGSTLIGELTNFSLNFLSLVGAVDSAFGGDRIQTAQPLIDQLLNQNGTVLEGLPNGTIHFPALFGSEDEDADLSEIAQLLSFITRPVTSAGTSGSDILAGGNGNDTLATGGVSDDVDVLVGTNGSDRYEFTNITSDSYFEATYILQSAGVTFNINGVANTGTVVKSTGTDTLINVAGAMGADGLRLEGSEQADIFNITVGANQWVSLAGIGGADQFNLTLNSTARLDYRDGSGPILANLAAGGISEGGGTVDALSITGTGRLEIRGTDFADTYIGSDRNESFITQEGNDTIDGGGGYDRLRMDRRDVSTTTIDLGAGTGSAVWNGTTFTYSISGIEWVRGSSGDDDLTGDMLANEFEAGAGDDTVNAGAGDDEVDGDFGADVIDGEEGADDLDGGAGNDTIDGGAGNDTIEGDDGDDDLDGGDGNDSINAGLNNDSVDGGTGNDTLNGEIGFDTLNGGAGNDVIDGGSGADSLSGDDGNDRILGGNGFDNLFGGAGNDTLLSGDVADRVFGGDGNDVIRGGSNVGITVDGLFGEAGDDTIYGDGGFDLLDGGDGDDLLFGGNQADNLFGRGGEDTLDGGNGFDRLFGGADNDLLFGQQGTDGLFGQQGNDTLSGGTESDRLFGGAGNDELEAGADDDVMFGGAGFDRIIGGAGNDTLEGNFNADTFVFSDGHGNDTVTDFAATNNFERIDLSGVSAITSLADLDLASATNGAATQVGADVLITTSASSQILLQNVSLADLDANDFIF